MLRPPLCRCLLQFEDFNSNDAFPLLEEYKKDHLTYNDDIQGTAAVAVAAIMGAIKLRDPLCTNYVEALQHEVRVSSHLQRIGALKMTRSHFPTAFDSYRSCAGVPLPWSRIRKSRYGNAAARRGRSPRLLHLHYQLAWCGVVRPLEPEER